MLLQQLNCYTVGMQTLARTHSCLQLQHTPFQKLHNLLANFMHCRRVLLLCHKACSYCLRTNCPGEAVCYCSASHSHRDAGHVTSCLHS